MDLTQLSVMVTGLLTNFSSPQPAFHVSLFWLQMCATQRYPFHVLFGRRLSSVGHDTDRLLMTSEGDGHNTIDYIVINETFSSR